MSVFLSEVFTSVQGEGPGAGVRALFLRFAGCNLQCSYCDTPAARERTATFRIHGNTHSEDMENPVECGELVRILKRWYDRMPVAVLTGGEPLLQAVAASRLASSLRTMGFRVYLETNGTLPKALRETAGEFDLVITDIKLPATQGGRDLGGEHSEFLRSLEPEKAAVKVVIPAEAADREVLWGVDLVAKISRDIPVFLQPVFVGSQPQVDGKRLLRLLSEASRKVNDVRLSIQMHKILKIR
jgi:7-carboxy-7-deazaguanine synthase